MQDHVIIAIAIISIHAPRVGRDLVSAKISRWGPISIHAPRVGRDTPCRRRRHNPCYFNPRAPCGARQETTNTAQTATRFQSTRPVWGATTGQKSRSGRQKHFNPRAPCGARLFSSSFCRSTFGFQSTRPVWGATANLTILPRQICTKGTKEFLLGRKTHGKKEKIKQKLAYIHAFSAFLGCEGSGTFCALVLRTQYR